MVAAEHHIAFPELFVKDVEEPSDLTKLFVKAVEGRLTIIVCEGCRCSKGLDRLVWPVENLFTCQDCV